MDAAVDPNLLKAKHEWLETMSLKDKSGQRYRFAAEAFATGWNAAMKVAATIRRSEKEIRSDERRRHARWYFARR